MLVGPNIIVQEQIYLGAKDISYSTQVWVKSDQKSFLSNTGPDMALCGSHQAVQQS